MVLWSVLAIVVFNVVFDWNTRMAGRVFVRTQLERREQGLPVQTINEGFRPMVRQSAIDAAKWLALVAGTGAVLTLSASKLAQRNA